MLNILLTYVDGPSFTVQVLATDQLFWREKMRVKYRAELKQLETE